MCKMIPDEKKPIPWGLPPLRSEVLARQRQQQQQQGHSSRQASANTPSDEIAEKRPSLQPSETALFVDQHYAANKRTDGYSLLSAPSLASSSTSHLRTELPSVRKRLAIFLAGMGIMGSAIFYIRHCMCDPLAIDPSTFSATSLGTCVDTLAIVDSLLHAGLDNSNTVAWDRLAEMTDLYGNRMTASEAYDRSAEWVVRTANEQDTNMTAYTEPVWVNDWRRGSESLRLFVPTRPGGQVKLPMLGLGNSVATPRDGIEANVVPVHSFEELKQLGNETISGNVVLFNFNYTGYSDVVRFRSRGAVEAQKYGAVAVLVRTVAPDTSFDSVHTGSSSRADIPAASISAADANLIERMYRRAQSNNASPDHVVPRVKLVMNAQLHENAKQSANVIIDLAGSEKPEEIVLLSGHFDSWDVGVGAMDDGAGAFVAWEAARLISQTGRSPRRTIRVVMWNNEETLQRGAKAYFEKHRDEIALHKFAIESDIGVFEPWGLTVQADSKTTMNLENYGRDLLKILGAGNITTPEVEGPGEDISILCKHGVFCAGLLSVNPENGAVPGDEKWSEHYFRFHHANSDRMEVIDKHQLRRSAAALAAWSYLIADLP
ncbi:hypothetical protein H4R99_006207 [Coemansia sp. RSA 1722]|nr:hypothetical protein H4R99_006207 [Coemansia sp. RSA 1722]KAJ2594860.1 hypothetical protein GGF39_004055 [Coemansia sp. RSA 1721]KAJ2634460.1 hypothetical protein GGF40_004191 [Coemansia sp. RSA 1286]